MRTSNIILVLLATSLAALLFVSGWLELSSLDGTERSLRGSHPAQRVPPATANDDGAMKSSAPLPLIPASSDHSTEAEQTGPATRVPMV